MKKIVEIRTPDDDQTRRTANAETAVKKNIEVRTGVKAGGGVIAEFL